VENSNIVDVIIILSNIILGLVIAIGIGELIFTSTKLDAKRGKNGNMWILYRNNILHVMFYVILFAIMSFTRGDSISIFNYWPALLAVLYSAVKVYVYKQKKL